MAHLEKKLAILERLVSWNSTYLADYGVSSTVLTDSSDQKQNLIATIGDPSRRWIVLSGYTDVAPSVTSDCTSDPVRLRVDRDKVFGRRMRRSAGCVSTVPSL